jgi:hypothetical protein
MTRLFAISLVVSLFAISTPTQAEIYRWRDATGVLHYSDVCPAGVICATGTPTSATVVTSTAKKIAETTLRLRSPIGTNLEGITYWTSQLPFVDVMKSSSAWGSNDGRPLDLDVNGYVRSLAPGQTAHKLTLRAIGGRYPAGRYVVRYKGEGRLTFNFDARVVSQQPGEMLIEVTPSNNGVWVEIEATNPLNYLRDIEMIMPGGICEGDAFTHVASPQDCGSTPFLSFASSNILFYPVFADRLRGYSVLRFMDWMETNNSPVTNWSQRTPMSYSTWATTTGGPIEVMIALANLVGAHPWFTIPHQSDDAYVQNLAQMVKAQLNPALGIYVEYSNEVWNSIFAQKTYVNNQAGAQSPPIDGLQYHALRSRTVGRIFKDVLGESRVVAVLGAQAASPSTATRGLDYLKSRFGTSIGIDAVAIAPYFAVFANPDTASTYTAMTLDAFFAYVRTTVLPEPARWTATYRQVANAYGVRLIAYEGGQHLNGVRGGENDPALNALFDAFNRDPRVKQIYLDYLAGWKQAGGELFVHFNDVSRYTKRGRWGALEYIAQPRVDSPKFDALRTFIEHNPVWWMQ